MGLYLDYNQFYGHFMNLCKTIGISGLKYYTLGTKVYHFQTYSIKIISQKKKSKGEGAFVLCEGI